MKNLLIFKIRPGQIDRNKSIIDKQDFKKLVQTLGHDSRVKTLYNIDLSEVMQFICMQLRIPPTSKVEIEYDDESRKITIDIENR